MPGGDILPDHHGTEAPIPAWNAMEVSGLASPDFLVEVGAILAKATWE